MTLALVLAPFEVFLGLNGAGLNGGKLFIGVANQDPEVSPLPVYWDAAGTIPASQPIDIIGGYITNAGTPSRLYVNAAYSLRLRDDDDVQVYYAPEVVGDRLLGGSITPEAFGYTGDNTAADRLAFQAAQAEALATGQPVVLTGTTYNLGTDGFVALGAINYYAVGRNVSINGAILPGADTVASGNPIKINFNNGTTTRDDTLANTYRLGFSEKSLWLGQGDQDTPIVKAIPPGNLIQSINSFPGSDTWPIGSYGFVGTNGIGFDAAVANQWYAATMDAHGISEISCSIFGTLLLRGIVVLCTSGAFVFYAPDSGGPGSWYFKATGGGVVTTNQDWEGRATHASWYGVNSDWRVRLYDHKTIGVVINGVEVFRYTIPSGIIERAGMCVMRNGATGGASLEYFTAVRRNYAQGGQPVRVSIFGDSEASDYVGGWSDTIREVVDGSAGVRFESSVNYAVPGTSSLYALGAITGNPPVGKTDVILNVGTNDVQGGVNADVTVDHIDDFIDIAYANGARVHICVPGLWYPKALAGGFGEDTLNYEKAAKTRMGILNLAAMRGASVIDIPQVTGQVLATQRTTPDLSDPRVRDNIHPTAFLYRLQAMEIGKSIVRQAAPAFKRSFPVMALPSALQNGWTAAAAPAVPGVSLSEGTVSLSGTVVPGTLTNGTVIYTLPRSLWPARNCIFAAPTATTFATLTVSSVDGTIKISNAAGATLIALDGVRYRIPDIFG